MFLCSDQSVFLWFHLVGQISPSKGLLKRTVNSPEGGGATMRGIFGIVVFLGLYSVIRWVIRSFENWLYAGDSCRYKKFLETLMSLIVNEEWLA